MIKEEEGAASPYLAWDCSHNLGRVGAAPTRDQRRINQHWYNHKIRCYRRRVVAAAMREARVLSKRVIVPPVAELPPSIKKASQTRAKKPKSEAPVAAKKKPTAPRARKPKVAA